MPAAAVIPALRAYIKVVAFKTPVVEIAWSRCPTRGRKGETTGKKKRDAIRMLICAPREKRRRRGEGEKACALFTSAFNFSANFLPLGTSLSLEACAGCVCEAFLLPLPLFSNPSGCLPCLFVTIKKLECL